MQVYFERCSISCILQERRNSVLCSVTRVFTWLLQSCSRTVSRVFQACLAVIVALALRLEEGLGKQIGRRELAYIIMNVYCKEGAGAGY